MAKGSRETAALRALKNQVQQSLAHLELVDASLSLAHQTLAEAPDKNQPLLQALRVNGKYDTLHLPARQHQQLINVSRGLNLELCLQAFYGHFLDYLRSILLSIHKQRPLELVRDAAVDLEPWEIAGATDEESLRRLHLLHAFRNLEVRGSAELLLDRTVEEVGLALSEPVRREALQYLEMRNLILYNGGAADERFARAFGNTLRIRPGQPLPRSAKLGRKAARAIEALGIELDRQLLTKRLIKMS